MQQILISLLVGILLGLFIFFFISQARQRQQLAKAEPSRFSEKEAEGLLGQAGYRILDKQFKETIITNIDGKDHVGYLLADYTVQRDKDKFVVVIKTGEGEGDPNEPVFRRKLMEYRLAFKDYGILVLDVGRGELHEVHFRFPHERNIDFFFRFLTALFIVFGVIGIIWLLISLKLF